jgi:hypothetical protein
MRWYCLDSLTLTEMNLCGQDVSWFVDVLTDALELYLEQ